MPAIRDLFVWDQNYRKGKRIKRTFKGLSGSDRQTDKQNDNRIQRPCRIGVFGFGESPFVATAASPTHQLWAVVLKKQISNQCESVKL